MCIVYTLLSGTVLFGVRRQSASGGGAFDGTGVLQTIRSRRKRRRAPLAAALQITGSACRCFFLLI